MFSGVVKINHLQKHLEKQKRASVDEGVENWGTLLHSSSAGKESTCNAGDLGSILGTIRWVPTPVFLGFPGGSAGKESSCDAGDLGSIPGLGRSMGWQRVGHDQVTFTSLHCWGGDGVAAVETSMEVP